jgi:perosamine synthetase
VAELPLLPYGRQTIEEEDAEAVRRVLFSDYLTTGPEVDAFEAELAAAVGAPYAVAVSSGTAALHLAALALDTAPGDTWITSPLTFVASANAGVYCGATPELVDIDPVTRNLSPERLAERLRRGPRPKAIVAVHYAGLPAAMPQLRRLTADAGVALIEDACHALGARYRDGSDWFSVGACAHSDLACFSFHPVKHITTGEGGAITTRSRDLYERLRTLRTHGIVRDPARLEQPSEGPWYYELQALGFNYRIPDIECALGRAQLTRLGRFVERRRRIAALYREGLTGVAGVVLPAEPDGFESSYHLYPVWFDETVTGKSRRQIFAELQAARLGVQVHYIPVHHQPLYRHRFGMAPGQFPESDRFYAGEISIPMYPKLTDDDVRRVIETVRRVVVR